MAEKWALPFYSSKAWQDCRAAYRKTVGGLCEDCFQMNQITPGDEVHHLIKLTPDNINNPAITLNFDNLRLLCRDCHIKRHNSVKHSRYRVDELGRVIILEEK